MDFLGIGWGEILVILIVALLLFGPGKVIEFSRSLGKAVRAFKKAASDISAQINTELEQNKESTEIKQKKDNN